MNDLLLRAADTLETHAIYFRFWNAPDINIRDEYAKMIRIAADLRARHAEEAKEKKS